MDYWIDWAEDVPKSKRQKTRGEYRKGYPEGLIVHFTAGHHRQRVQDALSHAAKSGMSYLLLDPTGKLHQSVSLERWGYHAGDSKRYPSAWKGLGFGVSSKTVGVEVMCPGKLDSRRKAWFSKEPYAEEICRFSRNVDNIQGGWYYAFTPEQEATLIRLCHWLHEHSDGVFSYDYVLGHDEVSGKRGIGKNRKNDPGASLSMSMDELRELLRSGNISQPVESPFKAVEPLPNGDLKVAGLTKRQFLQNNREWFEQALRRVNVGASNPVTLLDFYVVAYLEAGLSRGQVNNDFTHSEGERGILPWPKSKPGWNEPMTPERNIEGFMEYLVDLKNGTYAACFDRFDATQEARVLAAVVHGWGYRGVYNNPDEAFRIAATYVAANASREGIRRMLSGGDYENAGSVVDNRLRNIEAALALV